MDVIVHAWLKLILVIKNESLVSNICITEDNFHFHNDTYMRHKFY